MGKGRKIRVKDDKIEKTRIIEANKLNKKDWKKQIERNVVK